MREGDWHLQAVNESRLPPVPKAREAFVEAMDHWDEAAADRAVTALARSASAQELFEIFCRYGARDFREIGHKAIYVANAQRTLLTIGWQHAEPILRSLAYAMLAMEGSNPSQQDSPADRAGRQNRDLAANIGPEWRSGRI